MGDRPTALNVYMAVDLLFNHSDTPVLKAKQRLSAQKIESQTSFSPHCLKAQEHLLAFRAEEKIGSVESSSPPNLSTVTPLLPVICEPTTSQSKTAFLSSFFESTPHHALTHAIAIMLNTICAELVKTHRLSDTIATIVAPEVLPESLDPKWWWLMSQTITILEEHSVKPALELLNKSLQPEVALREDSLEHPIWGMAYLLHCASKRTVLQDLEHFSTHVFTQGPSTLLGFFMWLYEPELFPPSWLQNTVNRRLKRLERSTASSQQLRLFGDNR